MRVSQAQQANRALDGAMPRSARQDSNGRRAIQTLTLDIPPALLQQRMARSRQTGRVRHLTAGREREAGGRGKAQDLFQPATGHFLDNRSRRPAGVQRCILVPSGCEPVRRQCRRERATDHPPEEPSARGTKNATLDIPDQFRDHLLRRHAVVSQDPTETLSKRLEIHGRPHGTTVQRVEVRQRMSQRGLERSSECRLYALHRRLAHLARHRNHRLRVHTNSGVTSSPGPHSVATLSGHGTGGRVITRV